MKICLLISEGKFWLSKLILSLCICIMLVLDLNVHLHRNNLFSFNQIVWKGINIVPRESIYKLIMYVECLITLVIFFFITWCLRPRLGAAMCCCCLHCCYNSLLSCMYGLYLGNDEAFTSVGLQIFLKDDNQIYLI